jgi:hypothetical protein
MSPVLVLAGLAAGGYYLMTKGVKQTNTNFVVTDPASGTQFKAQVVSSFADGTQMVDVFTLNGSRIVRFQQTGSDKTSRVEIISPAGVDPAIKKAAMNAYGIRPKAA